MDNILTGKLVRLAAQDPQTHAPIEASWSQDTVYSRLLAVDPVKPPDVRDEREHMERMPVPDYYSFSIIALADDRMVGSVRFFSVKHNHGEAFVGIGIGKDSDRGKGYGTDAMRTLLRFGFQELNLHRVSLDAVATNLQAVRSYEKSGFVHEGVTRGTDYRHGVYTNLVAMGILRREWDALQAAHQV